MGELGTKMGTKKDSNVKLKVKTNFIPNNNREPIHFEANNISFSVYSKEEVLKLSTVEVFNPTVFNALGHPLENGLHDFRMGPYDQGQHCGTCYQTTQYCSGHIGHICLPVPCINPLYTEAIKVLLKMGCIHCHILKVKDLNKIMFKAQMQFIALGMASQAETVGELSKGDPTIIENFLVEELEKNKNTVNQKVTETIQSRMLLGMKKDYTTQFSKLVKMKSKCPNCGSYFDSLIYENGGFIYKGQKRDEDADLEWNTMFDDRSAGKEKKKRKMELDRYDLNAADIKEIFRKIYENDKDILDNLFPFLKQGKNLEHPTDLFFIEVLSVPPSKSRPPQHLNGIISMHPQSTAILTVLERGLLIRPLMQLMKGGEVKDVDTEKMIEALRGDTHALKLSGAWKELQKSVDMVLDSTSHNKAMKVASWGLKQLIERKEGMFRMNMMGKRVNHAARTVITPDPNIKIDEIGVPEVFAKGLSYPVPVTPFNVRELREMVLNGADKYPGANMVEDELGRITSLSIKDESQRAMIANTLLTPTYKNRKLGRPKIVYRQMRNGDALLLNRQPSLHKPSIMAHKARVLKGEKVMRLHYSNCKSYNADFDGDEMNIHLPQSERGRAEAFNICLSSRNYLGPKDGEPLQGLIQDHVIAGVKMTLRGRFFTRAEYLQLVFQAIQFIPGRIKTLPPAILKPQVLWSGKQVLSTIIINIIPKGMAPPNFFGEAKIRAKLWQNSRPRPWKAGGSPHRNDIIMSESDVVIRDGLICSGILDKSQYGATAYSLTHLLFELYGERSMCSFLSGISQMFTFFLQSIEGFTLGVDDIIVQDEANMRRKEVMRNTAEVGDKCATKGVGAKKEVTGEELRAMMEEAHRASRNNPRARMELDSGYKEFMNPATNDINSICVPAGLIKPFPHNNLQLMVNSGAKGSTVNTTQISCLLGQIELEGKRPPVMISGKSLPSFPAYCTQPRAGGYIDGRFMTGIQPQEFFFHCMAGREGLIDTAVKTSRSGYLQRCLVKLLEGLMVHHDFTVRDSDGAVVQFQYGEDSMDICKSQYIKSSKMVHIANNLDAVYHKKYVQISKECADLKSVKAAKKEVKSFDKNKDTANRRFTPFLEFSRNSEFSGYKSKEIADITFSRSKNYFKLAKEYFKLENDAKSELVDKCTKPDPVASRYLPPINFSSLTEVCDEMINSYAKKNKNMVEVDKFKDTMYLKVQQASVDPGEPVGVLAAQSVGEPSTQMTLNTFHFAGRGEMNVTLGIPRLREILMVASADIATPSLTVPFRPDVSERERDKLRKMFNRIVLSDLLEEVQVQEKIVLNPKRVRTVVLKFKFLPHKVYKEDFNIKPAQVLSYMENRFFDKVFFPVLKSKNEKKEKLVSSITEKKGRKGGGDSDDEAETRNAEKIAEHAMGEFGESDDEEIDREGEGTDMVRAVDRKEAPEYEGMDEEDEQIKQQAAQLEEDVDDVENQEDEAIGDMDFNEKEEADSVEDTNVALMASGTAKERRREFLEKFSDDTSNYNCEIVDYKYDVENNLWCEVTLNLSVNAKKPDFVNIIKKSAGKGVIFEVKGIKKAFIVEKDGQNNLQTDGINFERMYKYGKLLDLDRLRANSIHDMAKHYGVEAAGRTIVQEIKNVFGVYGINVDYRHLSLIADYMTVEGCYKPFNRYGMKNNPSPLQQMTFETAVPCLRSAVLNNNADFLQAPSACLVMGKHVGVGTGSVNLKYRIK